MVVKESQPSDNMSSGQIVRRNPSGTKSEEFYGWPDESFDEMDSTLAVQQYIQQIIRKEHTDIDTILTAPEGQDEGVWKYEHLRQFCLELNGLAVKLQSECTAETCSQMTATEQWIFLCAAHKTPKECPAIDYTRHTLDGAACLLNSNKYFPSRVSIKDSSVAKLGSVCRRVYRIFSHAYYHHRHIFDEFENETCLCRRFTVFVIKYNLMSRDNLIVPILEEPSTKTVLRAIVHRKNYEPGSEPFPSDQDDSSSQEQTEEETSSVDSLSATIIQASDDGDENKEEEQEEPDEPEEEGFGHAGGTPNFATLKPSKSSADKKEKESPNTNNSNNSDTPEVTPFEVGAGGDLQSIVGEGKTIVEDPVSPQS